MSELKEVIRSSLLKSLQAIPREELKKLSWFQPATRHNSVSKSSSK